MQTSEKSRLTNKFMDLESGESFSFDFGEGEELARKVNHRECQLESGTLEPMEGDAICYLD